MIRWDAWYSLYDHTICGPGGICQPTGSRNAKPSRSLQRRLRTNGPRTVMNAQTFSRSRRTDVFFGGRTDGYNPKSVWGGTTDFLLEIHLNICPAAVTDVPQMLLKNITFEGLHAGNCADIFIETCQRIL